MWRWRLRFSLVCFVVIAGLKEGFLDEGFEGAGYIIHALDSLDNSMDCLVAK